MSLAGAGFAATRPFERTGACRMSHCALDKSALHQSRFAGGDRCADKKLGCHQERFGGRTHGPKRPGRRADATSMPEISSSRTSSHHICISQRHSDESIQRSRKPMRIACRPGRSSRNQIATRISHDSVCHCLCRKIGPSRRTLGHTSSDCFVLMVSPRALESHDVCSRGQRNLTVLR